MRTVLQLRPGEKLVLPYFFFSILKQVTDAYTSKNARPIAFDRNFAPHARSSFCYLALSCQVSSLTWRLRVNARATKNNLQCWTRRVKHEKKVFFLPFAMCDVPRSGPELPTVRRAVKQGAMFPLLSAPTIPQVIGLWIITRNNKRAGHFLSYSKFLTS